MKTSADGKTFSLFRRKQDSRLRGPQTDIRKVLVPARFLLLFVAAALAVILPARVAVAQCSGMGYAHLDVSWRWSVNEGINKMRNTTVKQLTNMERYPNFTFSFDNPMMYSWMEEYYPDLYAQIRSRIKEGRWEPISGMWVDPMVELEDGESFVRQWLMGKRYVRDKFGYEIKVGSDVDQYGAWPGGNLPQIAKKSGIEYYTFARGLKDTNGKFFWWRGIDGTKIFSHDTDYWFNCPEGNCGCSSTTPSLKYYGAGDGGGGPALDQAAVCGGADSCGRFIDFFGQAEKMNVKAETTLTAEGYTLASDGISATGILIHRPFLKLYNRKNINLLMEAEMFALFARASRFNFSKEHAESFLGGCKSGESGLFNYPQQDLNNALKKFLVWQHHDNLPGNFTWDGVRIARNDLQSAYNSFDTALDSALLDISSHVNTEGSGTPLLVFNSLSWPRSGVVEIDLSGFGGSADTGVVDGDGRPIPSQISADGRKKLVFQADDIPAVGFMLFRAVSADKTAGVKPTGLTADPKNLIFENKFFILEIDSKTGFWKRVFDKSNNREVLDGGGNILGAADKDAWPYGERFREWGADLKDADSIVVVESGPVRVKIRVQHGVIFQDTILYANVNRIDSYVWSDKYMSGGPAYLRVVFKLNVADGTYTTEGPYGYAESPDKKTDLEKPTLSWQDLSGGGFGASIINDSKYGGDRVGNSIKLSLIGHAEFDDQRMLYSLYPHKGGWREGLTQRMSNDVNNPLIVRRDISHGGEFPISLSFLEASPENVIVSVVKKHEDSEDAIVRIYETNGVKTKVRLTFGGGVLSAREIDMMEWNEDSKAITLTDENTLEFDMTPYEIKTLRVSLPPWFGNKVSIVPPGRILLVQGSPSTATFQLSNTRQTTEKVDLTITFPKEAGIAPVTRTVELNSGETKDIQVKIDTPQVVTNGFAVLDLSYSGRRDTKKAPFEVMPSVPKFEGAEVALYKVWEAEAMPHKMGMSVDDPDAGNAVAWRAVKGFDKENDHLMFGPYEQLPEGRYIVSFRVKVAEKTPGNVAAFDVFVVPVEAPSLAQAKVKKTISGADFPEAGKYADISLAFRQPKYSRDEFRVFWYGKSSFWIDRIAVFKVVETK
ncbi:MAG: glycoside hydrolase family 38 C-terminal domain-containing protein [bacterium]